MEPKTLSSMSPSEQQLKNRLLASEGKPIVEPETSFLDSVNTYNPQTIMDKYSSARKLTTDSAAATAKKLESEYSTAVEDTNIADTKELTGTLEGQTGFAQMPVALNYMQMSHDKRIRDLTKQKNELLLANESDKARRLSDLILDEETAISTARTNFLTNYFNINKEKREIAGFQTPDQKAVQQLQATAPDANILPTDDYTTAIAKYKNSETYKRDVKKGQLEIQKAEAEIRQANAAAAKSLSETSGEDGYTPKQKTALTKLNENVSKNATYGKTTSMRSFGDNVIASLSQKNGVADIAAINQFQKVIDEGAVTRDQDVVLIQNAQSLVDKLKLKVKKLEKGDQLSEAQRKQMQELVEKLYQSQVAALLKDPYISAKKKEAELYGLTLSDTILGELESFLPEGQTSSTSSTGSKTLSVPMFEGFKLKY